MAAVKNTPGPWETSGYAIIADGSLVAHVVRDMGVDVEGKANARLIAAAPELSECGADLLASLDPDRLNPEQYNAWCRLSAVIAKAEGRS